MVTAFILMSTERGRLGEVAQEILKLDGITEVYSVAGQFDLVAVARVKENEQLSELVGEHLLTVEGIARTETLIAFRQYSDYDLQRMFSIGSEG